MTAHDPHEQLAKAFMLTQQAVECSDAENYKEGEALLRRALSIAPDNETINENYVQFCLDVAYNNLCAFKKYHEAIKYFKKALEFSEGTAEVWMDLGTAYAYIDDPAETLEAWKRALAMLDISNREDKQNIDRLLENIRIVQKAADGRKSRKKSK